MKKRLILIALSFFLISCANKSNLRYDTLSKSYKKNGFDGAIAKIEKEEPKLYGKNSSFLYHFDLGLLHHYKNNWKQSIQHFSQAEKIYEDLFTKSVTNEAAALLTNDNTKPYRARPFELLSLYQFQILNYLAMGDVDGALVEVRRAQISMQALYQKDQKKMNENALLHYLLVLACEIDGEHDDAALAYYHTARAFHENKTKIPSEVFEFISHSLKKSDRAELLHKLDYQALESTPKADHLEKTNTEIILITYLGHSPILGELYMSGTFVSGAGLNVNYKDPQTGKRASATFIAPVVAGAGGTSFHVGFSLPEKRMLPFQASKAIFTLDKKTEPIQSEVLMDFNHELTRNLADDRSSVITKTAARVVIRTIAAQKAKKAASTDNIWLNLLTSVGTDVLQSQIEQADLRMALFLPNTITLTRIPVEEGTHQLSVNILNNNNSAISSLQLNDIQIKKGQKAFFFVPVLR